MKRINPDTGKPFKRGDKRPSTDVQDGKIFNGYRCNRIQIGGEKAGFYGERWVTHDKIDSFNLKKAKEREIAKKAGSPKRKNPETGKPFKEGYKDSDGRYFLRYQDQVSSKTGFLRETWGTKDDYIKRLMQSIARRAKNTCIEKNLPHDIDADYLISIYPKDYRCPILGYKFKYGVSHQHNHSLDRIIPSKGYVRGNVIFISQLANQIKNSASKEQLQKVTDFYRNLGSS